eukprot:g16934.t1
MEKANVGQANADENYGSMPWPDVEAKEIERVLLAQGFSATYAARLAEVLQTHPVSAGKSYHTPLPRIATGYVASSEDKQGAAGDHSDLAVLQRLAESGGRGQKQNKPQKPLTVGGIRDLVFPLVAYKREQKLAASVYGSVSVAHFEVSLLGAGFSRAYAKQLARLLGGDENGGEKVVRDLLSAQKSCSEQDARVWRRLGFSSSQIATVGEVRGFLAKRRRILRNAMNDDEFVAAKVLELGEQEQVGDFSGGNPGTKDGDELLGVFNPQDQLVAELLFANFAKTKIYKANAKTIVRKSLTVGRVRSFLAPRIQAKRERCVVGESESDNALTAEDVNFLLSEMGGFSKVYSEGLQKAILYLSDVSDLTRPLPSPPTPMDSTCLKQIQFAGSESVAELRGWARQSCEFIDSLGTKAAATTGHGTTAAADESSDPTHRLQQTPKEVRRVLMTHGKLSGDYARTLSRELCSEITGREPTPTSKLTCTPKSEGDKQALKNMLGGKEVGGKEYTVAEVRKYVTEKLQSEGEKADKTKAEMKTATQAADKDILERRYSSDDDSELAKTGQLSSNKDGNKNSKSTLTRFRYKLYRTYTSAASGRFLAGRGEDSEFLFPCEALGAEAGIFADHVFANSFLFRQVTKQDVVKAATAAGFSKEYAFQLATKLFLDETSTSGESVTTTTGMTKQDADLLDGLGFTEEKSRKTVFGSKDAQVRYWLKQFLIEQKHETEEKKMRAFFGLKEEDGCCGCGGLSSGGEGEDFVLTAGPEFGVREESADGKITKTNSPAAVEQKAFKKKKWLPPKDWLGSVDNLAICAFFKLKNGRAVQAEKEDPTSADPFEGLYQEDPGAGGNTASNLPATMSAFVGGSSKSKGASQSLFGAEDSFLCIENSTIFTTSQPALVSDEFEAVLAQAGVPKEIKKLAARAVALEQEEVVAMTRDESVDDVESRQTIAPTPDGGDVGQNKNQSASSEIFNGIVAEEDDSSGIFLTAEEQKAIMASSLPTFGGENTNNNRNLTVEELVVASMKQNANMFQHSLSPEAYQLALKKKPSLGRDSLQVLQERDESEFKFAAKQNKKLAAAGVTMTESGLYQANSVRKSETHLEAGTIVLSNREKAEASMTSRLHEELIR